MQRPKFETLKNYQEFQKYYWYRQELVTICKKLGIEYQGTKAELNHYVQQYFSGNIIKHHPKAATQLEHPQTLSLALPLLACGFAFNQRFRNFFAQQTQQENFHFTADMATAWRRVKQQKDRTFTLQNMLDIYQGKTTNDHYDHRICQWNNFVKAFCADQANQKFHPKLKVAAILWQVVKQSEQPKVYSRDLIKANWALVKAYQA
ncbi:SAP domain-containing protein [Agrilactobacillus fermenti]|uniref:SAP domain-containing protein n=1 Tax=Agrilactobacillus fermenti TaxID=2586909 RepID=UPI001E5E7B73|nr:SAP domain-containing protein [Agrilactobacillus fermenti]MCD2255587.1 hypothetical protein [Agrilactobacillus fermenti]